MTIVILGVDLGKNSCSVVGVDAAGAVVVRRSMRRQTLIDYVSQLPACVVAMEACCGAHYLGRLFAAHGHEIRLMPPEYVRPYVKAQKNDDRDAEGIAEAASRPTMRFVELKSQEQLDIQTLHRVRSRLIAERTGLINQLRAILMERGVITAIAMNGACIVHDFELAFAGATSEDVGPGLREGNFGMAEETGRFLNGAIRDAATAGLGLGNGLGRAFAGTKLRYRKVSIIAAGARLGVPVTVHVAVGTDIID